MGRHASLVLDTLDDRREVQHLLGRLHPRARLRFLAWCCRRVGRDGARPAVARKTLALMPAALRDDEADRRLALECYVDFWALGTQWGLDLSSAARELERRVRAAR